MIHRKYSSAMAPLELQDKWKWKSRCPLQGRLQNGTNQSPNNITRSKSLHSQQTKHQLDNNKKMRDTRNKRRLRSPVTDIPADQNFLSKNRTPQGPKTTCTILIKCHTRTNVSVGLVSRCQRLAHPAQTSEHRSGPRERG